MFRRMNVFLQRHTDPRSAAGQAPTTVRMTRTAQAARAARSAGTKQGDAITSPTRRNHRLGVAPLGAGVAARALTRALRRRLVNW